MSSILEVDFARRHRCLNELQSHFLESICILSSFPVFFKNSNIVSYKLHINISEKDSLFVVFLYKTQGRDGKEIRGMTERKGSFEPRYEKIDFLHMRKQRHRSAAQ